MCVHAMCYEGVGVASGDVSIRNETDAHTHQLRGVLQSAVGGSIDLCIARMQHKRQA